MFELEKYIATPLTPGDEVNVSVGGLGSFNVIKCEVVRVEYDYYGQPGLNKVLVRSFDNSDNQEYDEYTNTKYMGIVLQQIAQ